FPGVQQYSFPVILSDRLHSTLFMQFPVQVIMLFLFSFSSQGRGKRNPVEACRCFGSCQFGKGGQQVPESPHVGTGSARFYHTRPPGGKGLPDTSFIEVFFDSPETAPAVIDNRVPPSFLMRPVISGENDKGV